MDDNERKEITDDIVELFQKLWADNSIYTMGVIEQIRSTMRMSFLDRVIDVQKTLKKKRAK